MSHDPFWVELERSWHAALLLGAISGGGFAVPWVIDMPVFAQTALSLGVAASGLYSIAKHALRCMETAVTTLYCDANENWYLTTRSKQTQPAALLPGSYVHPLMTIMRFRRADGKLVCVMLLADGLDSEDFRRLRVHLRTRCD